jgi:hypothetical protein
MPRLTSSALLCATMIALVACSSGTPQLMNLRNTEEGPDEFAVLPTAPLEIPENLASLPEPTPGAPNRVDPNPRLTRSRRLAETQPARAVPEPTLSAIRPVLASRATFARFSPPRTRTSAAATMVASSNACSARTSISRRIEGSRWTATPSWSACAVWAFARRLHRHPPSRQAVTALSGRLMPPLRSICH